MLDDSDVELTAILTPTEGPAWLLILGLAVLVFVIIAVAVNRDECSRRRCERGKPILANHECLCAEPAQ